MKTKMKRQRQTELPRFTVGALAIAGASAASGATVQITLTGNKISSTGGNQLVADLTGDSVADLTLFSYWASAFSVGAGIVLQGVADFIAARAVTTGSSGSGVFSYFADARLLGLGVGLSYAGGMGVGTASYLNPITFTDSSINGGAPTDGWLQVNAFNTSATDHTVELYRLIFDDASATRPAFASIPGAQTEWSAVPEPSSLGLLALGAGCLLLRRSRAKAAA